MAAAAGTTDVWLVCDDGKALVSLNALIVTETRMSIVFSFTQVAVNTGEVDNTRHEGSPPEQNISNTNSTCSQLRHHKYNKTM